jgi:hypothetical protein
MRSVRNFSPISLPRVRANAVGAIAAQIPWANSAGWLASLALVRLLDAVKSLAVNN